MNVSTTRRTALAVIAASLGLPALAQNFPSKVVTMVVPYPAGGASDFVARLLQTEYQKQLGQTVVVDNIGGVSGSLGVQKVLGAAPDGHTQVLATPMELVLAPLALSAVKFKPEDVRLAGLLGSTSMVLLVRKDIPASNVDELLAWAKGKELSYGSVGPGSLYHLMGEKFAQLTGQKMLHVPYKGIPQLMTDISGGQVDMGFFPLAGPVPGMMKEGRFKAIGIAAPQPHALYPDLQPLSRNRLLPDFNFTIWIGLQVPRATPDAVVTRINQAVNESMRAAEIVKGIVSTGSTPYPAMNLAELERFYTAEIERYRAIFRSINLQPQ